MANYNSMATPAAPDGLGLSMNSAGPSMAVDSAFDADLAFDETILDNVQGLPGMPFTPSYDFDPFSTAYDDPFAYPSRPNFGSASSEATAGLAAATATAAVSAGPVHHHVHGPHAHRLAAADADNSYVNQEASPQDDVPEKKLLSFSSPLPSAAGLVDENGQFVEVDMTAELYGMFFVAEDVFEGGDSNQMGSRPQELTCYRRNLWQCSGRIILPRHLSHVMTEQGQAPIAELAASIVAVESIEGKTAEIISIPWKSANPPAGGGIGGISGVGTGGDDHHKAATAPPRFPLDLAAGGQDIEGGGRVSLPVSWKRLQFKHATANNGRRKGLQQHYVVQISLLVRPQSTTPTGTASDFIKVAEIRSSPVIVRGRSPRNFDSRKDVQLSSSAGTAATDKKVDRRNTTSSINDAAAGAAAIKTDSSLKTEYIPNMQRHHSLGSTQQSSDWSQPYPGNVDGDAPLPPVKKIALSPNLNQPPMPGWSSSSGPIPQDPPTPTKATSPLLQKRASSAASSRGTMPIINLSLSEDERSPPNRAISEVLSSPRFGDASASGGGGGGARGGRTFSSSSTAGGHNPLTGSPIENADMLYEYFPLTVDDWMQPVDAIYRPHVVHHTLALPEVKAQQVRTRAKRYFAAD